VEGKKDEQQMKRRKSVLEEEAKRRWGWEKEELGKEEQKDESRGRGEGSLPIFFDGLND